MFGNKLLLLLESFIIYIYIKLSGWEMWILIKHPENYMGQI